MSTELPPIGAKIRVTRAWNDGTRAMVEGLVSEHPAKEQTQDFVLLGKPGKAAFLEDRDNATVTVEILSKPEPADGTWVTTPNRIPSRPAYVFHRDDAAVLEAHATLAEAGYRWYFHEDSEWTTWANVQGYGEITVIKDGAA